VRWILALASLVSILAPAAVRAEDPTVLALYARALQHFNPQLGAGAAADLARATIAQADEERLDARLLVALIAIESRWDPSAVSPAGARGLAQIMPQTAAGLGIDPDDPFENIAGAARHLRALLDRFEDRDPQTQRVLAIAAYNAGLNAVLRYGGIPPYPETQRYVAQVITLWRRLAGE
jgi:soluble lytic murein transglycosylase-like protein